ncbi:hypothetical protein YK48G_09260 [Lentilactobacillus fungorum]|uniref:Core domain-containing protein n=1 Tax=Lentilactobacillus fungorum TaxID=2201250 RepID=A0ABQ3VZ74_9LACO|nr:iron-sulfur cluster biosynthesis family protein [Lentilactobacillus fungorum]GHP13501.1 hypothetical protein YK48G_09260 [Lentilactobacillus fungorum]
MKLMITDNALTQLKKVFPNNRKFLLSFDDGVGPFSKVGVCSLDTSFDIIAVDPAAEVPDYDAKLSTNFGDWYYKGYSKMYLDDPMKLDFVNQQMKLSGNSGILDGNIALKDFTAEKAAE